LKRIGLIVNPYAGIGGRVGLKGSDGEETRQKALEMGAVPQSPSRTVEALRHLSSSEFKLITYPRDMGENEAIQVGITPTVIGKVAEVSSAEDTRSAAEKMLDLGVDLLVFAGGDGTARDVYSVIGEKLRVLGIPTGVKIHSGVFALNPRAAGELLHRFINDQGVSFKLAEVMDIDEEAYRSNSLQASLYGYMHTLYAEEYIQSSKESSGPSNEVVIQGIATEISEKMVPDTFYILCPGTTVKPIADRLGISKTLLGVDVVKDRKLIASDVNEKQLLSVITGNKAKLVVTVIGGQGFVFGRGNQQISPDVIRLIGRDNIIIVATPEKLASLKGHPLRVDTGDTVLDDELKGYYRVHTGYGRITVVKLA
jgi:predicted polyphosphate/ATP-dependent NAD kinase